MEAHTTSNSPWGSTELPLPSFHLIFPASPLNTLIPTARNAHFSLPTHNFQSPSPAPEFQRGFLSRGQDKAVQRKSGAALPCFPCPRGCQGLGLGSCRLVINGIHPKQINKQIQRLSRGEQKSPGYSCITQSSQGESSYLLAVG